MSNNDDDDGDDDDDDSIAWIKVSKDDDDDDNFIAWIKIMSNDDDAAAADENGDNNYNNNITIKENNACKS